MTRLSIEKVNIVLVGSFNPTIFHPAWFDANELVSGEADHSNDQTFLATQEIAQFKLPNQISIRVFKNKFIAETSYESSVQMLIDLVVGTFQLLVHTPVSAVGINLENTYENIPADTWKSMGGIVAPKDTWYKTYSYMEDLDQQKQDVFGLWSQTMKIPRCDEYEGSIFHQMSVVDVPNRCLKVSINNDLNCNRDQNNAESALSIIQDGAEKIISETKCNARRFMEELGVSL